MIAIRCCRLVVLSCLLLPMAHAAAAPQSEGSTMKVLPQAELEVIKVLVAQERAWNDGKLDEFLKGYKHSPQTTFLSGSIQHGSEEMAAHYHGSYPNREAMGMLSFSDLEPRLLDERFALVTGRYRLERGKKAGGNAQGIFSLVFEKTEDGWKIILDHTS